MVQEDIDFLDKVILHAPNVIPNLSGLDINQQIKIVKGIFKLYEDEPSVAVAVLENIKLDPNKEYDQQDKLLMALLVRRKSFDFVKSFKILTEVKKVTEVVL